MATTAFHRTVSRSRRNVEILTSDGVKVLGGIYQYGQVTYRMLYNWLQTIIVSGVPWVLHEWDAVTQVRGVPIASDETLVKEGLYVVAGTDGSPIEVGLTNSSARVRHSTISASTENYCKRRVFERDSCCLVSQLLVHQGNGSRFAAAHIFPRAYDTEWISKGFASKITDPAPLNEVGGPLKIDSIQNILLMRKDIHAAFNNYCFSINPDDGYRIIPFIAGYDDIAGNVLKLDHIQDSSLRPLDDLLRDHFFQAVLMHMKGVGAREILEFEDALEDGFELGHSLQAQQENGI